MQKSDTTPKIFRFDEFEVDERRRELRRGSEVIPLQQKAFDLLLYVIQHPDKLLSRSELLDKVWFGQVVTDNSLNVAVAKCRKALGQLRGSQDTAFIENVHGQGYRFTRSVQVVESQSPLVDSPKKVVPGSDAWSSAPPRTDRQALFVGREAVMERLRTALEETQKGHGSVCALIGEPGIGKSRVAEALEEEAEERGIPVWWGRCREDESMPPFWPWIQIIRSCTDMLPQEKIERSLGSGFYELKRLLPELSESKEIGEQKQVPMLDQEAARFRTFDAISRLLKIASAESSLVLVLDDLHWSDGASIKLLAYLVAEITGSRLLILATLRDTEIMRNEATRRSLGYLMGHSACQRIELARLTSDDVSRYTAELLGRNDPQLNKTVYDKSEGNPFFMTELLRTVSTITDAEIDDLTLMGPALEIVRRRILNLGSEAREVLSAAAVVGRVFDLALLAQVCDMDIVALLDTLEDALATDVIVPVPEGMQQFSFGHVLIREVLYEDLSMRERARLHLAIGEALEKRMKLGAEVVPGDLAFHFYASLPHGQIGKAVEHACRAAEKALDLFAYDEAGEYYQHALQALDCEPMNIDLQKRCSLLISIANCHVLAMRFTEAEQSFARAVELAREHGWPRELAMAAIGLRDSWPAWNDPVPQADERLSEALELLPDEERVLKARVLSRLARGPIAVKERLELSRRAAEMVEKVKDPTIQCDVLLARMYGTMGPDALDERERLADEVLALADLQEQPYWKLQAVWARLDVFLRRGEKAKADAELDRFSGELGTPHSIFKLEWRRLRLQQDICNGHLEGAEEDLDEIMIEWERFWLPYSRTIYLWLKSVIHGYRDERDEMITSLEMMFRESPWLPERVARPYWLFLARRFEDARKGYESYAANDFSDIPDTCLAYGAFHLARLCVRLGDTQRAGRLYEIVSPYASQNLVNMGITNQGSISLCLGELAWLLGRQDAAQAHYKDALAMNEMMGNIWALIETKYSYSLYLDDKDRDRAEKLRGEAKETAERLGLLAMKTAIERLR